MSTRISRRTTEGGLNITESVEVQRDPMDFALSGVSGSKSIYLFPGINNAPGEAERAPQSFLFTFANGVQTDAYGNFSLPTIYDFVGSTGNPSLRFHSLITQTGTGTVVRFKLKIMYRATGELSSLSDEDITNDVTIVNTAARLQHFDFSLDKTKMTQRDMVSFKITRMGGAGPDTFDKAIGIYTHAEFILPG